jgi:hypothetical protein
VDSYLIDINIYTLHLTYPRGEASHHTRTPGRAISKPTPNTPNYVEEISHGATMCLVSMHKAVRHCTDQAFVFRHIQHAHQFEIFGSPAETRTGAACVVQPSQDTADQDAGIRVGEDTASAKTLVRIEKRAPPEII